ncbi:hypothetical protein CMK11_11225 [Candidatus Poribacteria bacterium]|nr:hypothetical protein [Candidatus Poribacteria bacterium]
MQKLLNIDRRVVFLGVALVLFLGLVLRPVIPLPPSSEARKVFDAVEAVDADQAILIAMDYGISSRAELDPMSRAALHHAFGRGARVLCVSFDSGGAPLAESMLGAVGLELGKVDGVDYVFLGYQPDITAAIMEMGSSIAGAFPDVDVDGETVPTDSVAVMDGVTGLADVALALEMTGSKHYQKWVDFANAQFGLKLCTGATGAIVTGQYPYLASGQITGLLRSTRGAADYETMVTKAYGGLEPDASSKMSVLFLGHLLMLAFIALANIGHWATRRDAQEAE